MKVGDRVTTEDGPGVIIDVEEWTKGNGYGVMLDSPPDWNAYTDSGYCAVYYWEKEIKKV